MNGESTAAAAAAATTTINARQCRTVAVYGDCWAAGSVRARGGIRRRVGFLLAAVWLIDSRCVEGLLAHDMLLTDSHVDVEDEPVW